MQHYVYQTHPSVGPLLIFAVWFVQLLIAFLIYRDAKEQKMLAPVWVILAILPLFGYLVDVLYLVIREVRVMRSDKPLVS
jgi:hypothetical protein